MKLDELLESFSAEEASDLHLAPGSPPMLRTLRGMRFLGKKPLTAEDTERIAGEIFKDRHRKAVEEKGACQFSYSLPDNVFRISVYKACGALCLAVRQIPGELPTLDQMEVPAPLKDLARRRKGLILITGPAGSGKTSTLHGIVDYLNKTCEKHVITIEDPIEYFHKHEKSIVNQREVGIDVPGTLDGVLQALQQDPDVLVIGKISDHSVADAALLASETGHLVLSTLNTGGTVHAINWMLDATPLSQLDQFRHRLSGSHLAILSQVLLAPAKGKGSVPAYELMIMNSTIASLIRKNKIDRIINVMHSEKNTGMRLLDDSLYDLYSAGRITKEDMLAASIETVEIETRLHALKLKEEERRVFRE
jgi:twitching motility protein PilT